MSWLPDDFDVPARFDVSSGHHLRPIRADDVDIDYPADLDWDDYLALPDIA